MNKRDLIMAAATKSKGSMTQLSIQQGFELVLDSILDGLAKGEKITIANFGSFYVKEQRAKNSRNPATGEAIKVAAKKVIKFKTTQKLT